MAPASSTHRATTRASSRYSLSNLASMGKALADVINKDNSTSDKASKRPKETREDKEDTKSGRSSARRSNATVESDTARRRQSLGAKPPAKDAMSPGATLTSRSSRRSSIQPDVSIVSEEGIIMSKVTTTLSPSTARRASLRPRTINRSSGLPQYRPRSMLVESNKKQLTPQKTRRQPSTSDAESELTSEREPVKKRTTAPRLSMRRRLSSSDDEQGDRTNDAKPAALGNKSRRSISPLPKRAREANIPVTVSPSTPVRKVKIPMRQGSTSPTRMNQRPHSSMQASPGSGTKIHKATSSIPRPPSSASLSSSSSGPQSRTPRTPPTPTPARNVKKSASPGKTGSPLRHTVPRREDSPLGRFAGRTKNLQLSPVQGSPAGSVFVEGNSFDSVADVEFMLGTVASPTAPTPAIPRLRVAAVASASPPETPSRLPARSDMSYLSPLPPGSKHSPRPLRLNRPGNDRGSILSWDQLAAIGDRSLGEGEVRKMISEVPAPFSTPSSPALSTLDLQHTPESPSLSSLPSPVGYGSISQVLLPDVTPSPAPMRLQYSEMDDRQASEAALVTTLRLQLASAEHLASERLYQLQMLDAQLGTAKDARMRDTHELAAQVTALEEQMRATLDARERTAEEHSIRVCALEEQLHTEARKREQAVRAAVARVAEDTARLQATAVAQEIFRWRVACSARQTSMRWDAVCEAARGELDMIAASRETLAVLLSGLDQCQTQLLAA